MDGPFPRGSSLISEPSLCYLWTPCNASARHIPQDGDKFWRMPECYVRGSTIKYLRIPDEVIDMVKEEVVGKGRGRGDGKGRGGQRGRGQRGGEAGARRAALAGWGREVAVQINAGRSKGLWCGKGNGGVEFFARVLLFCRLFFSTRI